jgi:hypothetical protein
MDIDRNLALLLGRVVLEWLSEGVLSKLDDLRVGLP